MTNPVVDCLLAHRSIRKYKPAPIEPEVVDLLLRTGIRAPTAANLQHYALVVVDDAEKRAALGQAHAPLVIIALVDEYRIKRWLQVQQTPPVCNTAANHLFIGFWDAILALHNIVVAAESLGLGTCYIGGILSVDIQTILQAPAHTFPAGMVCLGYPDEAPGLTSRLPLEAVVHRNTYRLPADDEIRAFYHERDGAWDSLAPERKAALEEQGIHSIAQGAASQRYTQKAAAERSRGILANLKKSGFMLDTG
jgi:nitroreductase